MGEWFSFKQYRIFISLFLGLIFCFLIQFLISQLVQGYKFKITNEMFSWGLSLIVSVYIFLWMHNKIAKFDTRPEFIEYIKNYWNEVILCREPKEKDDKKNKETIYDKDHATKAFDSILKLRDLDNTLMWNRINLLLVFQGVLIAAVAAGIKDLSTEKYSLLFATIIIFGLFSSMMLFNIARGGSWWISHWEKHLAKIEYSVVGDIDIFREHISNKPELKRIWKKEGYVSTRDTIIHFTSVFPLIWAIILLIFLAGFSSSLTSAVDISCCLCSSLIGKT